MLDDQNATSVHAYQTRTGDPGQRKYRDPCDRGAVGIPAHRSSCQGHPFQSKLQAQGLERGHRDAANQKSSLTGWQLQSGWVPRPICQQELLVDEKQTLQVGQQGSEHSMVKEMLCMWQ